MQTGKQTAQTPTLPTLPLAPDLFGQILWDHYQGHPAEFFLRRDDNWVTRGSSTQYFRTWEQLPAHQRCLLNHARGRVLDLGAGAGQHAVILQQRGLEVTAVDASPLAVDTLRARGIKHAQVMDAHALSFPAEHFDTVLLLGNNLGLAGTPDKLRCLLQSLHRLVRPGGQILTDMTDYTATHLPAHLAYHRRNAARGRYPGVIRLRLEYQGHCGPTFDWMLTTLPDLRTITGENGWRVERVVQVQHLQANYAIGITRLP